ncbi:MAG: arginine--tRNA ligase [bacterium]|nr:arginine--tRNA ligase [bacterium]
MIEIKEKIKKTVEDGLKKEGVKTAKVELKHSADLAHGDFATNAALVYAKKVGKSPRELAIDLVRSVTENQLEEVEKAEVAGAGFINFHLKPKVFALGVTDILEKKERFGKSEHLLDEKVMVEYTDPNIFKPFHIGHLMSNAIGESISRLTEFSGAKVVRMCYPSDTGLHIAKAVWGYKNKLGSVPKDSDSLSEKTAFLGEAYVFGSSAYENSKENKAEIDELNKILYEKSDAEANKIYEKGRTWSLEHFEELYAVLGTKFDEYIFESEVAGRGKEITLEFLKKGVFEESEGAVIFDGEKRGLHKRVFVTSKGLPTYEAKEMGLNTEKFKRHEDLERSIIVTASEQDDYFKVVLSALSEVDEKIGHKTEHISHGMMRFAEGKMSSRKGNVITGEALLKQVKNLVKEKMKERDFSEEKREETAEIIAVGAIKYSILRQAIGGDIVFELEKSVSFEGDSGPYLQYSHTRASSVLAKARAENFQFPISNFQFPEKRNEPNSLERLIIRFPEIVERAASEYAPHHIVTYLTEIAGQFNSWYAKEKIVDKGDPSSPYKIALTYAFAQVMKNGLWLLGIKTPEKM